MKIRLRLFALAKQQAGCDTWELELPEPATVADVRAAFEASFPTWSALDKHIRFAVNAKFASDDTPIQPHDDVACIPPVSGG